MMKRASESVWPEARNFWRASSRESATDREDDAAFRADDDRIESRAGLRWFASGKEPFAKHDKDSQSAYVLLA